MSGRQYLDIFQRQERVIIHAFCIDRQDDVIDIDKFEKTLIYVIIMKERKSEGNNHN